MVLKDNNSCSLYLENLTFDRIEFNRFGLKNTNNLTFSFNSSVGKKENQEKYKVTLSIKGIKKDEYSFEISLTGMFSFVEGNNITDELKKHIITKNTLAILMPYLRSEVSLLTSQPGVDCVVLPPFNINNYLTTETK